MTIVPGAPWRSRLVDEPPLEQRDLHRLEIAGRGGADVGARLLAVGRRRLAFDRERQREIDADRIHRQRADAGGRPHAGQRADAADRVHVEARAIEAGPVFRLRQVDLHGQQIARLEARRHAHQLREAARHQSGADQQHQRERDFDDHQRAEQAAARAARACPRTRSSCRAARRATPGAPAPGRRRARRSTETASANSSTPASSRTSCMRGRLPSGSACTRRTPAHATSRPSAPPIAGEHEAFGEHLTHAAARVRRRAPRARRSRRGGSRAAPGSGSRRSRTRSAAGSRPRPRSAAARAAPW